MSRRIAAVGVLCALGACNGTLSGGGGFDGGASDAGVADGSRGMDAAVHDAGSSARDAEPADAPWVGTPCSVEGRPGTCERVRDCTGDRVPTPGYCPGPAEIQCCTERPDGDAGTPADASGGSCDPGLMPTPNAGLSEAAGAPGCPADGMILLGPFCIDRYEAALVLVDDFGAVGSWSPYHNPGTNRVAAVSLAGAVPQGYITGRQAQAACVEAGKRLCSDAEWLLACRGSEGRTYPYGESRESGVCNDARGTHPAVERFGTTDEWIWSALGDACINQLPDSLATTGAHPDCVTPEGVFDLMGNLHEWTSDPDGTFRGGFYADTRINGEGCLYRTTAHSMGHWDYSTGFRCCADAE